MDERFQQILQRALTQNLNAGLTGPSGATGPPGPILLHVGGHDGSVQYNSASNLQGTSRLLYDGVDTVTLHGQSLVGKLVGPGTGFFLNGNLTVSATQVYTSRNVLDDGRGNASVSSTLSVESIRGGSIHTPSLFVNGMSLVKPIHAIVGLSNTASGRLTFGKVVFSSAGLLTSDNQSLTLPSSSTPVVYLATLAGAGAAPHTSVPATLLINAPTAQVEALYVGSVGSESVLTISPNTSVVVSASTTVYTSFRGRLTVLQLV